MADERAFALKESVSDFAGGTIAKPDGGTIDVKRRLDNNRGVIVTSDPAEIEAFERYEAFKSVPVPKAKGE